MTRTNFDELLEIAVKKGCKEDIERLIDDGARIDHQLLFKAPFHNTEFIKELFNIGFDGDAKDENGDTLLIQSIRRQDDKVFKFLIDFKTYLASRVDRDIADSAGNTPLILAAESGREDYVSAILSSKMFMEGAGADVDRVNQLGETALSVSIRKGKAQIVSELLKNEASLSYKGSSVLELAKSLDMTPMVDMIEECAAIREVRRKKKLDSDLLEYASGMGRNDKSVQYFIDQGANVNARREIDGQTPLMMAVYGKNYENVKILLDAGARINEQNDKGFAALMYAVDVNDESILRLLVECGADLELKNNEGQTALFLASKGLRNHACLSYLIKSGGDVNIADKFKMTPLSNAVHYGDAKKVEILLAANAHADAVNNVGETPLMIVAYNDDLDKAKALIKSGADVNAKSERGETPLIYAVDRMHVRMAKLLAKSGADLNAKDKDGNSPLMLSFKRESERLVKLFMSKDINVNIQTLNGDSALLMAIRMGNADYSRELIAKGADVNVTGHGSTAVMQAAKRGSLEIIKLLVENGADTLRRNEKGESAHDIAQKRGFREVAEFLAVAQDQQALNNAISRSTEQVDTLNF